MPAPAHDVAKDILEDIRKAAAIEAARTHPAILESRMAEAVIGRPLLRIAQGFVGFVDFLELLLRLHIARVAVRMIFHGELAESALQFFFIGVSRHAERLVKISLHTRDPAFTNKGGTARSPIGARYLVILFSECHSSLDFASAA